MNRLAFRGPIVIGILVLASPAVTDERQERAEVLLKKAAELAEQGRVEDAERMEREALELRKSAQQEPAGSAGNVDSLIGQFEKQLRVMRAEAERLEATDGPIADRFALEKEIAHAERKLDELIAQRERRREETDRPKGEFGSRPHEGKVPPDAERIKHIFAAAEHLAAAGMHDAALDLRRRAEQMAQELRDAKQPQNEPGTPHQAAPQDLARQMEELRRQLQRTQIELKELGRRVERLR